MSRERPYHHGDLRAALLRAAEDAISEGGAPAMSMRDVGEARGVTHTAAAYHFGDRVGLLTAVATEGYQLLGDALSAAHQQQHSFLEVGVAYVRFAVTHPAHFEVMFQPSLYDTGNDDLREAKAETAALLYQTRKATPKQAEAGVAAWSLMHGLATLWLNGNLPPQLGDDPVAIARAVAKHLRVPATTAR